jgi:myo-inositol-hexaphosphate 3-phosphohydrolase
MNRPVLILSAVAAIGFSSVVGESQSTSDAAVPAVSGVASIVESTPVQTSGDSADDPAIWVHPTDPARSLVLVNNKRGALETYDLSGARVQRLSDSEPFWGNVDTRARVRVGNSTRDLVAVVHRGLQFYTVNSSSRMLSSVTDGTSRSASGEGLCLYRSRSSATTYAIVISRAGRLRQYALTDPDNDGLINSSLVRDFQIGSEAEGCVADDETGSLYVSQEDVALWRYGAEPSSGTSRAAVDRVISAGGGLAPDIEGLTLASTNTRGTFLFASAQRVSQANQSYFVAYEVEGSSRWSRYGAFRVGNGADADDCDRTDGIAAYAGYLGPRFPHGMFVCQDNNNDAPGTVGNQNVKLVPLESILTFLG